MVSERPSCISVPVSMIVSPPSCRMATSKETRVRVDGLSKIIASTLPSNGFERSPAFRRALRAAASSRMARRSEAGSADRSVKCLTAMMLFRRLCLGPRQRGGRRTDAIEALADLRVVDGQWRQQPHDIVARPHGKQLLVAHRRRNLGVGGNAFQPQHQPLAAYAGEYGGKLVCDCREALLEKQCLARHFGKEMRLEHDVEHR